MPHAPATPPGTRLFARLDRFHCECPQCGTLLIASKDPKKASGYRAVGHRAATQYNPLTSRLTCSNCRRVWGVGLVLWPVRQGRSSSTIPEDHRPTRKQLAQLRQYTVGIAPDQDICQGDPLNLAIDGECTCPDVEGGWRRSCPVHGWEAFNRRLEGQDD